MKAFGRASSPFRRRSQQPWIDPDRLSGEFIVPANPKLGLRNFPKIPFVRGKYLPLAPVIHSVGFENLFSCLAACRSSVKSMKRPWVLGMFLQITCHEQASARRMAGYTLDLRRLVLSGFFIMHLVAHPDNRHRRVVFQLVARLSAHRRLEIAWVRSAETFDRLFDLGQPGGTSSIESPDHRTLVCLSMEHHF